MKDTGKKSGADLPEPPEFSDAEWQQCRERNDFRPILFEWYKFVGSIAALVAGIKKSSPAFREIPLQHFHVLVGLLNRCARLMLANIALSHKGKFGDSTAILDRCIFESAVKTIWLCTNPDQDKFTRFLADGLKPDIKLKKVIESKINERGGKMLKIERRMLDSISRHLNASELSENDVVQAKAVPDLASILTAIGSTRLEYVAFQSIGSQHVHGTWGNLLYFYLDEAEETDGSLLSPSGNDTSIHINQFVYISLVVLRALKMYTSFALDTEIATIFQELCGNSENEITKIYREVVGDDFDTLADMGGTIMQK